MNSIMAMTEIEFRVSTLENEVTAIKNKLMEMEKKPTAWWQKISGTFADNADYEEAMRLGSEYRLAQKEENSK